MFKKTRNKLAQITRSIHRDEDGLEAMQVVMIVAIAATVLIAVMAFGQEAANWLNTELKDLMGKDIEIKKG